MMMCNQFVFGRTLTFWLWNHLPIQVLENIWLKHLAMCLCPNALFLLWKGFTQEVLPNLMKKIKQIHVLWIVLNVFLATTNFDLCDVLTLVNTLVVDWQPKHVIIGFIGVIKIIGKKFHIRSIGPIWFFFLNSCMWKIKGQI